MRVIRLEAENVKKIRAIDITPHGDMVMISGANGQGKSSTLDALWMAIAGKRAAPERPVRKGAEKAKIQVTLGSKGTVDLIVQRTFTANGTMTLDVLDEAGKKFSKPQEVLDSIFGTLTFDPLRFIRMDLKTQISELRNMVPLGVDVDALNAANKADYDARTEIKKDARRYQSEADAIVVQAGVPAEAVDTKELRAKLNAAGETNERASRMQRDLDQCAQAAANANARAVAARKEIAKLEKEIAAARKTLAECVKQEEEYSVKADGITVPDMVSIGELTQALEQAELGNRELEKSQRRKALLTKAQDAERRANDLTRAMEEREEQKRDALAAAPIPIAGLTFDESMILYNGIPLAQVSTAEQIRVSVGLAMADNPELRILRIMEGSLLDQGNLDLIAEMAGERDYQVWIECVDKTGKLGIVIEDGRVVADNE
jgi:AAA domain